MGNPLIKPFTGLAQRIGYTQLQRWKLGRGDGSGTVQNTVDPTPRTVWIWRDSTEGREMSSAILAANAGIPWANLSAYENLEVLVGYPPNSAKRYVTGLTEAAGLQATGNFTPIEQALQAAAIPTVGQLGTMRVDPSSYSNPTLVVTTTAFFYIRPSTRTLQFQDISTADLTATVGAIASGKHRYAWITYDYEAGTWGVTSSADQTPNGALPWRRDFTGATFASLAVANTAKRAAAVYLYFGQTGVAEADFYRIYDARLDFPLTSELNSIAGGQIWATRVVTAAGAVTVTTADMVVEVNKTVGAATVVNLPASPVTGQVFVITDGKGDAATNNITVTPAAGNIDGGATYVMNVNYQSAAFLYDGTKWKSLWTNSTGAGSGTVTSVGTGVGLSGGPITTSGTLIALESYHLPVRAASLSNVNVASPGASIGGVTMAAGDRVLLTANGTGNGPQIWNGAAVPMTRPADYAAGSTALAYYGLQIWVTAGSYQGEVWYCSTAGAITIDTTATAWTKLLIDASSLTGITPLANGGSGADLSATGGTGQVVKQSAVGSPLSVSTLSASDIPGLDASKIVSGQVTQARGGSGADMSAAGPGAWWQITNGGNVQAVEPQIIRAKNVSGATANANELGYIQYDSTNGYSYTTTTTANLDGVQWCVVIVGAANNSDIWVALRGQVTVKLNANCSIGNFLTTSTTAGQAAVSTYMRPQVFAVALSANAGGAGGTCTAMLLTRSRFVPATSSSYLYYCEAHSTTAFVATINGAPTATSVVYNAPSSGSDNNLVPGSSVGSPLLKQRLYNTTRGTFRLISSVNTGTKTITTVSSTDSWASTDTITLESQTVTTAQTFKAIELDMTQAVQTTVPLLARGLMIQVLAEDVGTISGSLSHAVHPFETYSGSKLIGQNPDLSNVVNYIIGPLPITNYALTWLCIAGGTGTAYSYLRLNGYWEAVP